MDKFTEIITYLALTSMAAERLTDIIKRAWLSKTNVNPVIYQVISGVFGAGLTFTVPIDIGVLQFNEYARAIVIGLAVSGGSSMWNDILGAIGSYSKGIAANTKNLTSQG